MYCEENFKRMSSFYVNEVHLITMLLPYMERKIHEDCEIYTVLQNSLDKIIKLLLSKLNIIINNIGNIPSFFITFFIF